MAPFEQTSDGFGVLCNRSWSFHVTSQSPTAAKRPSREPFDQNLHQDGSNRLAAVDLSQRVRSVPEIAVHFHQTPAFMSWRFLHETSLDDCSRHTSDVWPGPSRPGKSGPSRQRR